MSKTDTYKEISILFDHSSAAAQMICRDMTVSEALGEIRRWASKDASGIVLVYDGMRWEFHSSFAIRLKS